MQQRVATYAMMVIPVQTKARGVTGIPLASDHRGTAIVQGDRECYAVLTPDNAAWGLLQVGIWRRIGAVSPLLCGQPFIYRTYAVDMQTGRLTRWQPDAPAAAWYLFFLFHKHVALCATCL